MSWFPTRDQKIVFEEVGKEVENVMDPVVSMLNLRFSSSRLKRMQKWGTYQEVFRTSLIEVMIVEERMWEVRPQGTRQIQNLITYAPSVIKRPLQDPLLALSGSSAVSVFSGSMNIVWE